MAFLADGFPTRIQIQIGAVVIVLFAAEKEVQPPGVDQGGEIDTTTMRNLNYRTRSPKTLATLTEMTIQVSYDPRIYGVILNTVLGVNATISVGFPDGTAVVFSGWLDKFTPAALKEGEFPLAEIKIVPSNQSGGRGGVNLIGANGRPSSSIGAESAPVVPV